MSGWSPWDAIIMERRHILEGEQRVRRQEMLVSKLIDAGLDRLMHIDNELLGLLRESLELSRERLRDLEARYGKVAESC